MVIDSSAVMAILQGEPEREAFLDRLAATQTRIMSAATRAEIAMVVLARHGEAGLEVLDALIQDLDIAIVPLTSAHAALALDAFRRFGRGRHPAGLNFGDGFAYALARASDEPLLFKGDDFARTDIAPSLG